MRLTQRKMEEILLELTGPDGAPLIQQLQGKQNVSEFELAARTKKDIKLVRRILYALYNHNVIGFIRKKDKKKGWYIYYWTILPENVRFLYYKKKKERLVRLAELLEAEKKELFFLCPANCVRLTFDQAMEFEFHCPECGQLTAQDSNGEKKSLLKKQIEELQRELAEVKEEKRKVRKQAKSRKKEIRKKAHAKKKAVKKRKR